MKNARALAFALLFVSGKIYTMERLFGWMPIIGSYFKNSVNAPTTKPVLERERAFKDRARCALLLEELVETHKATLIKANPIETEKTIRSYLQNSSDYIEKKFNQSYPDTVSVYTKNRYQKFINYYMNMRSICTDREKRITHFEHSRDTYTQLNEQIPSNYRVPKKQKSIKKQMDLKAEIDAINDHFIDRWVYSLEMSDKLRNEEREAERKFDTHFLKQFSEEPLVLTHPIKQKKWLCIIAHPALADKGPNIQAEYIKYYTQLRQLYDKRNENVELGFRINRYLDTLNQLDNHRTETDFEHYLQRKKIELGNKNYIEFAVSDMQPHKDLWNESIEKLKRQITTQKQQNNSVL